MHKRICLAVLWLCLFMGVVRADTAVPTTVTTTYLPIITQPPTVEMRGVWVNRFDWTTSDKPADPAKIDEIVQNLAMAHVNTIFFQVRGTADAYYAPGLEPWAARVSGAGLGQPPNPYWDPLAYMIAKAHAAHIQVHAYLNVYPIDSGYRCAAPPDSAIAPTPLYEQLVQAHGVTDGVPNALQQHPDGSLFCATYSRVSPASTTFNDHFVALAQDLVTRYDLDGLHLDHARYGAIDTSCDPVSQAAYGGDCFDAGYANWQRAQVSGLLARVYREVIPLRPGLWFSSTAWPIYVNNPAWNWPGFPLQGFSDFYQDSKGWLAAGSIDSISPMIYPGGDTNCPDNSYWTLERWETLVRDFQADSNGRYIIPGIGSSYCTFDEIAQRIALARQIGTAGHALFSYQGLLTFGYFDDLAAGPYRGTAVVPVIP